MRPLSRGDGCYLTSDGTGFGRGGPQRADIPIGARQLLKYQPPTYEWPEYGLGPDTAAVVRALRKLPPRERRVFLLRQNDFGDEQPEAKRNRRFLYRYLPMDPGSANLPLERRKIEDLVVRGELYLSPVSQFNDPNEFRARVRLTSDPEASGKWMREMAEKHVRAQGKTGSIAQKMVDTIVAKMKNNAAAVPDLMQKTWTSQADDFGICCFSQNPRSDLMWAHYARSHRGICLQFDYSLCPGVLALAQRVQYRDDLPDLTWPQDQGRSMEPILSKAMDWRYEVERRYVSRELKGVTIRFDARSLTGVILGQRFDDDPNTGPWLSSVLDERERRGLPPVRVYRAQRSDTSYSLAIKASRL
jgi:hypothetical protein